MRKSRKGVALILTLVITFFLVVLLGAFLVVNRGNSSLTLSGVKRQKAYNACMTGLHYAWGELELNQGWGASGFSNGKQTFRYPDVRPKLVVNVHGDRDNPEDLNANYIEARLTEGGETFHLTLVNNLQNRTVLEDTQLGSVPGRSARIEIIGEANGSQLRLSSILRKQPFVDYSALSNLNLSVDIQSSPLEGPAWKLRSKDPYVNQVRSNQEILGPSAIEEEIFFKDPPRGGVAKATSDIFLDGTSVQSDPDFLTQSERMSNGTFQIGTASIDVPGLEQDDLRFPETSLALPRGSMTLRSLEKHEWSSRDFEVDTTVPPDGIPDTTITRWRLIKSNHNAIEHNSKLWVSETSFPGDDSGPLHTATDGLATPNSAPGFQNVTTQPSEFDDYPVLYGDEPDHRIRANLTTGEIALSPGTTFKVDGDFQLEHEDTAPQPNLLFGYTMRDSGETTFTAGQLGGSAIENPESNSAALVTSGDCNLDGVATGFGSIFADRSVQLRAKSGLRAEPDMAVAVHGESIRFTAEDPPDSATKNTLLEADWLPFQGALGQAPSFEIFEEWYDQDVLRRRQRVGDNPDLNTGVRSLSTGLTGSELWDSLGAELGLGPTPNFGSAPFGSEWTGELTLGQYIRLREYAKGADQSWLELPGDKFPSVVGQIDNQIGTYSRWSSLMGLPMEEFMSAVQPEIADVFFVGLVHAGSGGFAANTNGSSILVEGAVVSQGGLSVESAPSVDFVYNRQYLDDVIREFRNDHIKLDQVYFKIN